MYQIDKSTNRIKQLSVKKFAELGFYERDHLQEWIANEPESLGEELLIIQKEFDGFDETKERLDLLALDKDGNLVVIENKLDDSGRDVVWQALKYASYCSNLNKSQIVEIYQNYLNRFCHGGDAKTLICDFLEITELGEVVLNSGNQQRIMLVSAKFRKEVTSTVMWLLTHGINLQCFKVTPYELDQQLFLNIEQIIPTREAEEFMIGMSAKEADQKNTETVLKNRHKLRLQFWEQTLEALKISQTDLFNNISPTKDHWLNAGSGVRGVPYTLIFGNKETRVELNIARAEKQQNKFIFDQLYKRKQVIENQFGDQLYWERLEDKKASRVKFTQMFDGYDRDNWSDMIAWLIDHIVKLENAFKKPLAEVNKELKQANLDSNEQIDETDDVDITH
ncbi:MAG: DUF4268 domain-containing protein [Methylomicrobium sp.]|nr:DUF4268 domain-containing protein [Methylomicrobium sp.]